MTNFESMVKDIEAEIEALKAVRRRASANLGTVVKSSRVQPQIRGYTLSGTKTTQPTKYGVVSVQTIEPAFVSLSLTSATTGRTIYVSQLANNATEWIFKVQIYKGNTTDINDLNGSTANTKTVNIGIEITATADFDMTITQENI